MKSLAILAAVGLASAACAQSWDFEFDRAVLDPANPRTTVRLFVDPGPAQDYFAAATWDVHASEEGWVDGTQTAEPATRTPPFPGQNPGFVNGASISGISIGHLATTFGFDPRPGRYNIWWADYTATDFSVGREVSFETETRRFDVFVGPDPGPAPWPRMTVTPTEGLGSIRVIPAPGGLVLLGLCSLICPRRRRAARRPVS